MWYKALKNIAKTSESTPVYSFLPISCPKRALISVTNNICGDEPNKYLSDIIINK